VTNITDPASSLAEVNGVALMFWDIFEAKYGSGKGAVFLLLIPLGCGVFCGLHSITSASRYPFESCMFGNSEEKNRKRKEQKKNRTEQKRKEKKRKEKKRKEKKRKEKKRKEKGTPFGFNLMRKPSVILGCPGQF